MVDLSFSLVYSSAGLRSGEHLPSIGAGFITIFHCIFLFCSFFNAFSTNIKELKE